MEEEVERGEGMDPQGARGETGMASEGAPEDGLLHGPWLEQQGEGSPLWGWLGDEETLPF